MALFQKIAGVINSFFEIGGPAGPGINANGAALETKNAANSAFAVHRGASPVADNDFTTKAYVDTIFKPIPVSLQISGATALPNNSATEQYYVVTTTGVNGSIGQIYWDDGSNAGIVTVLAAKAGNEIVTTAAFSGGTITLATNQNYVWSGAAWTNISPNVSGVVNAIRMAVGTGASQSSATSIPANAVVTSILLNVVTPFSAGTTIAIGQTGTTGLLQATTDNAPTLANIYESMLDQAWGASALPLLITVTGAPAAGAGFAAVQYTLPNA